tara:strand:+ start:455 stop:955 length:501 start_codon:yes stop_codon:yes gene_type:complete
MIKKITKLLILLSIIICQENTSNQNNRFEAFQLSSERYTTNDDGTILMKVNIWGHVGGAGSHLVYDGIDFASLLSLVGGPMQGADLANVRLYRERPDQDGQLVYDIDLNLFLKTGDRSNFIRIKPNDTIIIPQKFSYLLLDQIGTINTIFSLVTIYLQLNYLIDQQ